PRALGPSPHRARPRVARARGLDRAWRTVPAPGGHRRLPRPRGVVGGHRVAAHRRALRDAGRGRALAGGGPESRGGHRHGRGPGGRARRARPDRRGAAARLSSVLGGPPNAIAFFEDDYLELLSVRDGRQHEAGAALMDFLARGGGLRYIALQSDDLAADVAAMRRRGVDVSEPSDGGRRTPAGQELR